MDLTCFVYPGWEPRIRPASARRDWMDASSESFAYRAPCRRPALGRASGAMAMMVAALGLARPALGVETSPAGMTPLISPLSAADPAAPAAGASASAGSQTGRAPASRSQHARFEDALVSKDARQVADWVVASNDNHALPFVIVDKVNAKVFVFDAEGLLRGSASALLGLAKGDDTIAGIGSRKLAAIRPEERTTPAGRFVAALGHDFEQDILWVDYDAALSLHRVIKGAKTDHRLRRLSTASTRDKRISYGCINVPVRFYETVVIPAFTGTSGIVYILPEVKSLSDVFPAYGVALGGGR